MHTQITPKVMSADVSVTTPAPITILDGGMGRELERRGAPFRQPEWSALALSLAPASVRDIHLDYLKAGATVITVNSYAVTPYHLGDRFFTEGEELIKTAAQLAFEAVQINNKPSGENSYKPITIQIAGCLPPLFGSYRPDLFDAQQAPAIAQPLLAAQVDYVDIWLVETQSSIVEALTWHKLITEFTAAQTGTANKPIWMAFTLEDSHLNSVSDTVNDTNYANDTINTVEPKQAISIATLRSGESVAEAVQAMMALNIDAVLFNCSQPEVMNSALQIAKESIDQASHPLQLGVYANAFVAKQSHKQANAQLRQMREDTTPEHYLTWAELWQASGATIIGGCCGIGVEHIERLAQHMAAES